MPSKKTTTESTFAELSAQLETILLQLQAEELDVDNALKLHEQGTTLIKQLEARLTKAEHTVRTLKSKQG